jgi:regulator of RNase E activity RraA
MKFYDPDYVISLTPLNPFDRFEDGRPRVPDDLLDRVKPVTLEEAWAVLRKHGYEYQFEGNWVNMHPERKMVGRAVTATVVPFRPDLDEVVNAQGKREERYGTQNNWVIQTVVERDVVVVDEFGKVRWGGFVGDNLSFAVWNQGGSGLVIDGGTRDTARMYELPDINVYCRGYDPSPRRDITLISLNGPTRIGQATCLPGDVVLGSRGGVIFIPPHLVEEVVITSEELRTRDEFARLRMKEKKYTNAEIDLEVWADHIEADYQTWLKTRHPRDRKSAQVR